MPRRRLVPDAADESAHGLDELCSQRRLASEVAFLFRSMTLRARSTLCGTHRRVTSHPGTRSCIGRHTTGRVLRPVAEAHLAVRAAVFRTRSTFRGTSRRTALLPAQFAYRSFPLLPDVLDRLHARPARVAVPHVPLGVEVHVGGIKLRKRSTLARRWRMRVRTLAWSSKACVCHPTSLVI